MSRNQSLEQLETVLESFLGRVVAIKERRLQVLEGINRLDDIVRTGERDENFTEEVGDWFAQHSNWLTESHLKDADRARIFDMLGTIRRELEADRESSPAKEKISEEIHRWEKTQTGGSKIVLKRPPETTAADGMTDNTISLFDNKMEFLRGLFLDYAENKKHVLSVLDDLLRSAIMQKNKDSLILSAFIIYYLKQNGYKVEPYVKKLKEAETGQRQGAFHA